MRTLNSELSSAELCRRNGWRKGTVLMGREGRKVATIKITAVGNEQVLAFQVGDYPDFESLWDLTCRNWKRKVLGG